MIQPVVYKSSLRDSRDIFRDLEFWKTRPPAERIAAVDLLRKQYGNSERLQKSARVIQRSQG